MILFCQTIRLLIAYRIWIQILHLLIIKHSMSFPLTHWFSWRTTILNDEKWCTHVLHWYGFFPFQLTRFCLWRTIYIYIFFHMTHKLHTVFRWDPSTTIPSSILYEKLGWISIRIGKIWENIKKIRFLKWVFYSKFTLLFFKWHQRSSIAITHILSTVAFFKTSVFNRWKKNIVSVLYCKGFYGLPANKTDSNLMATLAVIILASFKQKRWEKNMMFFVLVNGSNAIAFEYTWEFRPDDCLLQLAVK